MQRPARLKNAEEYLSKVRLLGRRGRYEKALDLAHEGLFYWVENASDFYLEMEKIYMALGDHRMVNKMDIEAMRALYWTKSKLTDDQRIKKFGPDERRPAEPREV